MDPPQPAATRYSPGDEVRVYLAADDVDADHHDRRCIVTEVLDDDLDRVTGRDTDGVAYRVRDADTGEDLPVTFRHADLVPVDE